MTLNYVKKLNIPITPGCYQFYNRQGEIIYIGKAANLKSRVFSYWRKSAGHTPAKNKMLSEIKKITWLTADSEIEALLLEANLIKKYQPYYNVLLRDDKRFAYIKISTADEIPGVFITRQIDKSGKYFGPFISSLAARETIRAIRKIWPYCNMRKAQQRPCFYYQIGRCLGVCAGVVSRQEYIQRVIKTLMMFLAGGKQRIVKELEARIKKMEKESGIRNKELGENTQVELAGLKFQLKNMQYVLDSAKVLSVGEKYANDAVELAKLLSLPKTPERIEGYDIANIFGREAVGAMVVFSAGEPDKSQYRKFKIKIGQGEANDAGMLREVLERRLKHGFAPLKKGSVLPLYKGEIIRPRRISLGLKRGYLKMKPPLTPLLSKEGNLIPVSARGGSALGRKGGNKQTWPLPDLIVVDGGKAQLNAVLNVLEKQKLVIPLIAIAKGLGLRSAGAPDKLFFPGQARPLELPLASPALHLIKRVRDEAHRFAIGYHRKLRSRKFIE